jgi:hypothetical protein
MTDEQQPECRFCGRPLRRSDTGPGLFKDTRGKVICDQSPTSDIGLHEPVVADV